MREGHFLTFPIVLAIVVLSTLGCPAAARPRRMMPIIDIPQPVGGFPGANANGANTQSSHNNNAPQPPTRPPGPKGCAPGEVLKVSWEAAASGDGRLYGNAVNAGFHLAQEGDIFEYQMMWRDADCNCGAEFESGATFRLRDHGGLDAMGYSAHSERNANMTKVAHRKWYHRSWPMDALAGRYVDKFVFSALLKPGTTRVAYFRYIRIIKGEDKKRRVVFMDGMVPPNINTYFPGTVRTECQATTIVEAVALVARGLLPGATIPFPHDDHTKTAAGAHAPPAPEVERLRLWGVITSSELTDDPSSVVPPGWAMLHPFGFFEWLALERRKRWGDIAAWVDHIDVLLRHPLMPGLTLINITRWNPRRPARDDSSHELPVEESSFRMKLPQSFYVTFEWPAMQRNAMAHLLRGASLEVSANTLTAGGSDITSTVFSTTLG